MPLRIALCLIVSWMVAYALMAGFVYAIEAPEIRNYEPGKPFFTEPRPEGYARLVAQQFRDQQDRKALLSRFEAHHSWPVNMAVRAIGFLLDPLDDAVLIGCFAIAWFVTGKWNAGNRSPAQVTAPVE